MEEHFRISNGHSAKLSTSFTDESLSPQILATIRSLIINPYTANSAISSIFKTLTRSLQLSRDPLVLHHSLKLLSDLAFHHPDLSPQIFDLVRSHSLSTESTCLAAESLAVLASISERYQNLVSSMDELDDQFFVSLCFGPSVPVRVWLLRNAQRFCVRPHLLFTVFLGFTKDPYPYVRKVALDGLAGLCNYGVFEDRHVIEGCYCRAVELLHDMEDCVRSAAIRVLCSMVRDMSMEVRVDAFDALGKIGLVSEDILLQTLSKKVLVSTPEKKSRSQCTAEWFEISASDAAGAFVHGLEDEFLEVRKSACSSLRTVAILSAEFIGGALKLLMGMLNDDSMVVKLQALETMHHMATSEHLKVQKIDMHMFIGTLVDNSAEIRSAARKILKVVKFPDLELFKLSIDGLLENLEIYPQDEADVFSVLFYVGRSHGKFVVYIIKKVSQEMEPASEGKLGFDSARVAAFLVLAISVSLSHEQNVHCIPPRIYSYAVTFLGRISHALSDVMSKNTLLAHLSQCSRSSSSSVIESNGEGRFLPVIKDDVQNYTSTEITSLDELPLQQIGDEASEIEFQSPVRLEPREVAASHVEYHLEEHDKVRRSMNLILAQVKDIWSLVQSGCTNEVLRTLRVFKEEVSTFTESLGSAGSLAFILQYLRVMKLLAKVWEHFVPTIKVRSYEMGELEILLGKLDRRLREMRCRFIGLSEEEELHVLELILVTCLLRLSIVEICHYLTTMKNLSTTISRMELLQKEGSIEPSSFLIEVKKSLHEIGTSNCGPFLFSKLLGSFSLKKLELSGNVRHIYAEVDVPNNNSENPLPFVSGLPVALPFEITLHNILSKNRLWLRITMSEESTHFIFLDLNLLGGCDRVRKFTFIAPFYRTPKAVSFTLRICIGVESLFEDIHIVKGCWGPKHELTYLCQEKEVYLSVICKD